MSRTHGKAFRRPESFTPAEIQRMKDAREEGVTFDEIGRRFSTGHATVKKLVTGQAFVRVETETKTTSLLIDSEEAQAKMIQALRELS